MAKGVFTTKLSPSYDDIPEERYHFPRTYLRQVEQTLGDTIVYYEPRRGSAELSSRGGRQSYFAIACPFRITADPRDSDLFYCHVRDFLSFDKPVHFLRDGHHRESLLRRQDGKTSKGAFGRSVRIVPDEEFEAILCDGLSTRVADAVSPEAQPTQAFMGVEELDVPFERPLVELTTNRPFRDLAFRRSVRSAYENRCALTGLHLINGGGRPEVQAAHIVPVSDNGSDSVRNGLALSGTIHWLFDRGLVSVGEDMAILTADQHIPEAVKHLLNPSGRVNLPADGSLWPHPKFLRHHRETYFKG
jgi:putative restriction endonuclease